MRRGTYLCALTKSRLELSLSSKNFEGRPFLLAREQIRASKPIPNFSGGSCPHFSLPAYHRRRQRRTSSAVRLDTNSNHGAYHLNPTRHLHFISKCCRFSPVDTVLEPLRRPAQHAFEVAYPLTMSQSTTKVKAGALWNKNKEDLLKQLGELKTELGQLRIQKIASSGTKLNKM